MYIYTYMYTYLFIYIYISPHSTACCTHVRVISHLLYVNLKSNTVPFKKNQTNNESVPPYFVKIVE